MALAHSDPLQRDVEAISRLSAVPTILRVVTEITGLRFSLVARVTEDQWVACAVHDEIAFGLKAGGTLDVATTLCRDVRDTRTPVVMDHASEDPKYCDHPTPKLYAFESYISVPIFLEDGQYFGNVCALDPKPALVNQPKILSMMKLFAELISFQLAAEARQAETRAQLSDARQTAELREQFIAVLGHDLRNPLASVNLGADMLVRRPLPEGDRKTAERIRASGRRMTSLVADLLDFARAKLGSGIGLSMVPVDDLAGALEHVIAELQSAHPERNIQVSMSGLGRLTCDRERICQLLSNLLANALEHGAPDRPIEVRVDQTAGRFQIAVTNAGEPIPADVIPLLFRPYSRGGQGFQKGLGLGLYIVSQIAKSHGGTIDVSSTAAEGTHFTFTLPL